ncbi:RNA polymerase sigma factor [Microlunatus parietis]|uniref:RNA polymerase sigma factor (Sigma-70 family) n=1 Tax=Microlunatus parietis TaxID=682979 RepID=A0A7Y9LBF9_9ACTN|nr:sigma-70 family RNA polymerase sigma factor [Microlunatus parietis]NYE73784.1 RNA polymerase sigma factor (sigma-70 family) [Microlunatus parietis]
MINRTTEDLLRELTPQVLGALVRRYGNFDSCEDAVSEALLAAATQWPETGVPEQPRGWLITVASRRLIDLLRADQARRRREESLAQWEIRPGPASPGDPDPADSDDSLILLFLCCHPSLSPASQIALTLRAVGGLTTAEIARAFLVPEATMTRRITRAKQSITGSGIPFALPPREQQLERVAAVLHVLYLIFNEGYASTAGPDLHRPELAAEAIRLARLMHRLTDDAEAAGLLALMLLTDARRDARTGPAGELITMAEQDRSRWDREMITEGVSLISSVLPRGEPGPYQLQAAIAAIHDEAPSADQTDWPQIVALYRLLLRVSDNPVVELNHAVAVAMAAGPAAGLDLINDLDASGRLGDDHRLIAVRAHLLELAGDHGAARSAYRAAADRAVNLVQQRYLRDRARRLEEDDDGG